MQAWLNLRYTVPERRLAFREGLKRHGFKIREELPNGDIESKDVFITWNRIGVSDLIARKFEERGLRVLVTENATWGNDFNRDRWYTIARNRHNTRRCFPVGDISRWDMLGVELPDFVKEGETVILPQRGIGSKPTAMPLKWPERAHKRYGGRVRRHPGRREYKSVEEDLAKCGRVVTWGSGAAIKAALMGIPVISEMPNWIGEHKPNEESRLAMFRQLAWAQWRLSEIESGDAFAWLL